MPRFKLSVFNPKINEYLYDRFSKLTKEQKYQLSSSEARLLSTEQDIRNFITWGSLEKKMAICTKVGIPFYLIFYESGEDFDSHLKNVYKQHTMKGLRLDNIEDMRDKGVFVVGNKEVALSLSLLAQNCHSDVYYLNRDFTKVKNALRLANDSNLLSQQNPLNPEYEKAADAIVLLSRFIFETKLSENFMRVEGLEMIDFMILTYLYGRAKNFVKLEALQLSLQGVYKPGTVAHHAGDLFNEGYTDKLPTVTKKPVYTITAKGIMVVSRIIHKITNNTVNT